MNFHTIIKLFTANAPINIQAGSSPLFASLKELKMLKNLSILINKAFMTTSSFIPMHNQYSR